MTYIPIGNEKAEEEDFTPNRVLEGIVLRRRGRARTTFIKQPSTDKHAIKENRARPTIAWNNQTVS